MNSTIEYIRQLNQASVHIQSDWLERLKQVEVGVDAQVGTPEIVLSDRSPAETAENELTRGSTRLPENLQSIVTPEERTNAELSDQQAPAKPIETSEQMDQTITQVGQAVGEAVQESCNASACPTGVWETTTIDTGVSGGFQIDSLPDASLQARPVTQSDSSPTPKPQMEQVPGSESDQPLPGSEDQASLFSQFNKGPKPGIAVVRLPSPAQRHASQARANKPSEQQIDATTQPTRSNGDSPGTTTHSEAPVRKIQVNPVEKMQLESPAILNDIVRPTVVPLGQDRSQNRVTQPVDPPPSLDQRTDRPQVIEMGTDFGFDPKQLAETKTLTKEDLARLGVPLSGIDEDGAIAQQTTDADAGRDSSTSGDQQPMTVSFPIDKRAERFQYEKTQRQKLIDSIVDQIVGRFPASSNPVILFVAANREIDVDSAASRVATCMAGRDIGNIMLVDGNMQSRQLTSMLALTNHTGISDAFHNDNDATKLAVHTDNPNLKIIGAGTLVDPDTESTMPSARKTNQSLKEDFAYTVISGGIAGDSLTDSWSAIVDGVYLIVDMDESDRNQTIETVDYFRQLGARIVGCIATRS